MNWKKLILVSLLLNFVMLALLCFWADSEAWPVKISGLEGAERSFYDYTVKPLFLLLLKPIWGLSQIFAITHMDLARVLFALNGLLCIYLGQRVVKSLTASMLASQIYIVLLMTSTLYLERGFRVRSDHLATTLILIGLTLALSEAIRLRTKLAVLVALVLISVGITPKSLLVWACMLPVFWDQLRVRSLNRSELGWLVPAWAVLFVVVVSIAVLGDRTVGHLAGYARDVFYGSEGDLSPWSIARFQYVWAAAVENPVFTTLVIFNLVPSLPGVSSGQQASGIRALRLCLWLLVGLVAVYPNRLPFFLASLLPLGLLTVVVSTDWSGLKSQYLKPGSVGYWATASVVSLHVVLFLWTSQNIYFNNNNFEQRQFLSDFTGYLSSSPNKRAYDPSGLLPNSNVDHLYLGPGQNAENKKIAGLLQSKGYDLFFLGQRFSWVLKSFSEDFIANTMVFHPGVMVVGHPFEGRIEKGRIAIREIQVELGLHHNLENLPMNRVFLRPEGGSAGSRGKVYLLTRAGLLAQPSNGYSWPQMARASEVVVPDDATGVTVFAQDFPSRPDSSKLKRILAFDRWL
ncbi:MAG: hypothetical protein HRT45_02395 [Bdellovibrionales bacterium]|nr:hypothetical protein [Bdellovibrionales bacterium]